jgi:hypothetical protein
VPRYHAHIDIRPAVLDDVDAVLELLGEAAEWTASIGFPNWPTRFPAARQVRARNRAWLRLDVPADNLPLCSHYERLGFEYRGDAEGELTQPDGTLRRWRNRLYERDCGAM